MCCPPSHPPPDGPEPPSVSQEELCRPIVRRLRAAYGWALIDEDGLVGLALGAAPASAAALEYLVRDQYSRVLYEACRQGASPDLRERAYAELQRYLFRAAYNRRPEHAEECVQRALELILAQIERCREPGAFLTFALNKLRHALGEADRHGGRDTPLEQIPEAAGEADTLQAIVEERDRAAQLVGAIGRLRDARQRQTLVLKFYAGLADEAIAARLAITPNLVRVLRHRALVKLRADPALAALLADP